jgi:hypothetical protein
MVRRRPRPSGSAERIAAGLREGIGFVFTQPVLLGAMSLDLFAVLFGGAIGVLPAFAQDVLRVGAVGFGVLRAAPALGSVAISLVMARVGELRRAGPVLLWAVAFFGMSWIGFAASRWFPLSVVLLALGGMVDNVSVVLRSTLVQVRTPQDRMGRVAAVNGFFIRSSNELGMFGSGVAARLMGQVRSVIFGGAMTLVTVGAVAWRVPAVWRLGRIRPDEVLVEDTAAGP